MLDDVVSAVPRTTIRKKTCVGRKTPQKFWSPIAGKCLEVVDASSCVRTPTLLPKKTWSPDTPGVQDTGSVVSGVPLFQSSMYAGDWNGENSEQLIERRRCDVRNSHEALMRCLCIYTSTKVRAGPHHVVEWCHSCMSCTRTHATPQHGSAATCARVAHP
jgi:hypothetical protein